MPDEAPLLLISILTLLISIVTLALAILLLRNSRRTLRLTERRIKYLSEEQERMALLHEEHQILRKALEQERSNRPAGGQPEGLPTREPGSSREPRGAGSLDSQNVK